MTHYYESFVNNEHGLRSRLGKIMFIYNHMLFITHLFPLDSTIVNVTLLDPSVFQ